MTNSQNQYHNDGKSTTVVQLKKEFIGRSEVRGFLFRQISVTKHGFLYEVFKKRINKRFATYSYPSSKSFGIWAWTFKTLNEATSKLESLSHYSQM